MWWVVLVGNPLTVATSIFTSAYAFKYSFYVIFQAIGVYFNLYYLIPKFLEKGKYVQYISLVITTIICTAILIVPGYYVSAWLSDKTFFELYQRDPSNYFYFFQINTLPSSAASMTLGMSVKLAKNWIQTKRREQELEKEKLETELKFLKYQFNPHFLFNSINSIFFLIHKNPDMASASLAKFSDLLRYQLYECNDSQIQLRKEIDYLENFIELEKLRQNNNIDVNVQIDQRYLDQLEIAPFILMTFVENAFKHVSKDSDKHNWITIKLKNSPEQLLFSVSNSVSGNKSTDVVSYGGIGLKNVKRRLDLIYPDQYELDIQSSTESFEVKFKLQLTESAFSKDVQKTRQLETEIINQEEFIIPIKN